MLYSRLAYHTLIAEIALKFLIAPLLDAYTPKRRHGAGGLLMGCLILMLAFILRLLIAPIEAGLPFLTFFPAVTLAAIFGGVCAGIFALCIATLLADYFFFPPYQAWAWLFHQDIVWSNAIFGLEGLLVIAAIEAMYQQQRRSKETEDLLRQLEAAKQDQQIAAVAFEAQEGVMITDANGVILRVNQAFTLLSGYEAHELVGKTPKIIKSGRHDAEFYRQMWQSLAETGT